MLDTSVEAEAAHHAAAVVTPEAAGSTVTRSATVLAEVGSRAIGALARGGVRRVVCSKGQAGQGRGTDSASGDQCEGPTRAAASAGGGDRFGR